MKKIKIKKQLVLFVGSVIIFGMILSSCGSDTTKSTHIESEKKTIDYPNDKGETEPVTDCDTSSASVVDLPSIYTEVFEHYMDHMDEISYSFDIILMELQEAEYKIEYVNPTDDDLGQITVKTDDDVYVYMDFYPNSSTGIETIMDINFAVKGVGEVSCDDCAHTIWPEMSVLQGKRRTVSSKEELREAAAKLLE